MGNGRRNRLTHQPSRRHHHESLCAHTRHRYCRRSRHRLDPLPVRHLGRSAGAPAGLRSRPLVPRVRSLLLRAKVGPFPTLEPTVFHITYTRVGALLESSVDQFRSAGASRPQVSHVHPHHHRTLSHQVRRTHPLDHPRAARETSPRRSRQSLPPSGGRRPHRPPHRLRHRCHVHLPVGSHHGGRRELRRQQEL